MAVTVITSAGIAAAIAAESRGLRVSINRFKIGSSIITPTPNMTDVSGQVYDSGPNTDKLTVSSVGSNSILYKVRLDDTIGNFQVGNIGLFLSSGVMFSITALQEPVSKISSVGASVGNVLTFNILLQINNIASAFDITLNYVEDLQIPEVPTENNLPPPGNATSPIYHVLNFGGTGMAAVATRQSNRWNFVIATPNTADHLLKFNNLSDLSNVATARTNLGLGTAATRNTGTTDGTVPLIGSGNVLSRTILPSYVGATSSSSGQSGIVPGAAAGQVSHYFAGDGTWKPLGTAASRDVGTSADQVPVLDSTGKIDRTVFPVYVGATSTAPGQVGAVPAAAAGQTSQYYLAGDGQWRLLGTAAYMNVGSNSGQIPQIGSGNVLDRNIIPTYIGCSTTASGQPGIVPGAPAGAMKRYFAGDGTWRTLSSGFEIVEFNLTSTLDQGSSSWLHNLGSAPKIAWAYLIFNITPSPPNQSVPSDFGWQAGDVIPVTYTFQPASNGSDYVVFSFNSTHWRLVWKDPKLPKRNSSDNIFHVKMAWFTLRIVYLPP